MLASDRRSILTQPGHPAADHPHEPPEPLRVAASRRDWTHLRAVPPQRTALPSPLPLPAPRPRVLRYLDQFGKPRSSPSAAPSSATHTPRRPAPCPLRQAWGSLDAPCRPPPRRLRGENGGQPRLTLRRPRGQRCT
ncbi:uncharacterized protein A4U43_C03F6190 [Asparagus officinalis]|uniref:ALOG domain-containing protein n=1 Tax=Asparagus officinalis TaxID=4686 RepID=A0A5P1F7T6_ASPOF|nr:uncharacterized protein A4U43_C03F6190 [Asparagus officinalis]